MVVVVADDECCGSRCAFEMEETMREGVVSVAVAVAAVVVVVVLVAALAAAALFASSCTAFLMLNVV